MYSFSYRSFLLIENVCLQTTLLNSSDGGKLGIQLRNKRAVAKRQHVQCQSEVELTEDEAEDMVELLKTTVVNSENMEDIKRMLTLTLNYRTQLLRKEELNLREYFPYFWVSKELVSTINKSTNELVDNVCLFHRCRSNFICVFRTFKKMNFSTNGKSYRNESLVC